MAGKVDKRKKRRKSSSNNETSSSSSSDSDSEYEHKRKKLEKIRKKLKKLRKKTEKLHRQKQKKEKRKNSKDKVTTPPLKIDSMESNSTTDVPLGLMERSKAMAPMTKEEWDKSQSVIRRVLDEDTGRYRLIKGDGEVLEEIVSRNRHKEINQQATKADGAFFQTNTVESKQ